MHGYTLTPLPPTGLGGSDLGSAGMMVAKAGILGIAAYFITKGLGKQKSTARMVGWVAAGLSVVL